MLQHVYTGTIQAPILRGGTYTTGRGSIRCGQAVATNGRQCQGSVRKLGRDLASESRTRRRPHVHPNQPHRRQRCPLAFALKCIYCSYVCRCMYGSFMYVYTCICLYVHMIYLYAYMHISVRICMYMLVLYVYVRICVCNYMHLYMHVMCMYTYVCVCISMYMCISLQYIHIDAHTSVYMLILLDAFIPCDEPGVYVYKYACICMYKCVYACIGSILVWIV